MQSQFPATKGREKGTQNKFAEVPSSSPLPVTNLVDARLACLLLLILSSIETFCMVDSPAERILGVALFPRQFMHGSL